MAESLVLAVALVGSIVGNALAQTPAPAQTPPPPDCAAMIKSVNDRVANRFDTGRHTAVTLTGQAAAMHKDNKTADCMAKVEEAAKAAGLAMNK
jgi:hypothetical protein